MPLDVRTGRFASVTDPATWCSYEQARASAAGVGLGFVLTDEDDISCVDLDDVIDSAGRPVPGVAEVVAALADVFYMELSPSRRGLHIWHRGPAGPGARGVEHGIKVERYSQGRYISITGWPVKI